MRLLFDLFRKLIYCCDRFTHIKPSKRITKLVVCRVYVFASESSFSPYKEIVLNINIQNFCINIIKLFFIFELSNNFLHFLFITHVFINIFQNVRNLY